jgi:hypothetical protein
VLKKALMTDFIMTNAFNIALDWMSLGAREKPVMPLRMAATDERTLPGQTIFRLVIGLGRSSLFIFT